MIFWVQLEVGGRRRFWRIKRCCFFVQGRLGGSILKRMEKDVETDWQKARDALKEAAAEIGGAGAKAAPRLKDASAAGRRRCGRC